jgi:hypothetical protein
MPQTPDDRSTIRARLLKVLRLAQQGVGGERGNAEALLEKLLRKHSMTMADLEEASEQARVLTWMPASDVDERTVLSQLAFSLFGTQRRFFTGSRTFDLGVEVSPSERAALQIGWDVYRAAFAEAREALVLGFCFKHGLYAAADASAELSEESRASMQRALSLAEALPEVESPVRRVTSGEPE